jgi:virginiamycin A acetyltransferase
MRWLWNTGIECCGALAGAVLGFLVRKRLLHFPFVSQWIALLPFSFGYKLRSAIYRRILPGVGKDSIFHWGTILEDERCRIGEDVWISPGCFLDYVEIGDHVLVGPQTILLSGGRHHRFTRTDVPIKQQGNDAKEPLRVGSDVWIGAGCVVMARLNDGCIVGAGSVVTKEVPPMAVVAGNPARVLYYRNAEAPVAHES